MIVLLGITNTKEKTKMYIISIANAKGGVAKTTTTAAVASILKSRGYTVLCMDLDPQGNLTKNSNVTASKKHGIVPIIQFGESIFNHIDHTEYLDIVPSNKHLGTAQNEMTKANGGAFVLDKVIKNSSKGQKHLSDFYDFLLIDTPPTFGPIVVNALMASDYVIVPVLHDGTSLDGAKEIRENIDIIREYYNRNPKIAGILRTRWEASTNVAKVSNDEIDEFAQSANIKLFNSIIRKGVVVSESFMLGENILAYDDESGVIRDYIAFSDELINYLSNGE